MIISKILVACPPTPVADQINWNVYLLQQNASFSFFRVPQCKCLNSLIFISKVSSLDDSGRAATESFCRLVMPSSNCLSKR